MKNQSREILRKIWQDVLQREDVAIDDNFFVLGGNSIKAVLIAQRIRNELGNEVQLIDILRQPTLHKLESLLFTETDPADSGTIPLAPVRSSYPLSAVQREFYLLESMTRHHEAAVSCTAMVFSSALSAERAAMAFRLLLDRHEVLRTTFGFDRDIPVQVIRKTHELPDGFIYSDLSTDESPEQRLQQIYEHHLTQPFDLQSGPLARIHVCVISERCSVALLSIHHIAADGFSAAILEQQFRQLYDAPKAQTLGDALPFHYKDFAHWTERWLDSDAGQDARHYWRSTLSGYRNAHLFQEQASARIAPSFAAAREDFLLGPELTSALTALALANETTLFVLLQSGIKTFLYREFGVEDLVTGSPITLRDSLDLSGQVGPYLNTLPIRTCMDSTSTFRDVVRNVNEATLGAYAHKLMPLDVIAKEIGHTSKLFDAGFTLQNQDDMQRRDASMLDAPILQRPPGHSEGLTVALWFVASQRPDGIGINVHYRKSSVGRELIVGMVERLADTIASVVKMPDEPLERLFAELRRVAVQRVELDFG